MNENGYKKGTITLTTIGPVHIGSGEEISKKECWVRGNEAVIMDMDKVMNLVLEKKLVTEFEQYMLNIDNIKTFSQFVNVCKIQEEFNKCEKYKLNNSIATKNDIFSGNVMAFIRHNGQPYIPASSIKGAIRTVLIANRLKSEHKTKKYNSETKNIYKNLSKKLEELSRKLKKSPESKKKNYDEFNKIKDKINHKITNITKCKTEDDMINDIMKCIIIRDGVIEPENGNTESCMSLYKVEFEKKLNNKNYNQNDSNSSEEQDMPIVKECINPEITIKFDIIIDIKNAKKLKLGNGDEVEMLLSEIRASIKSFYEDYEKNFRQHYGKKDNKEDIIYLGGGVGFISKTVLCQALETLFDENEIDEKNKIRNMIIYNGKEKYMELKNAPKMMKKASTDKGYKEMGRCKIEIGAK